MAAKNRKANDQNDLQFAVAGRAGDGSGTLSTLLMRILYALGASVFQWRADIYSNIKTKPTCFGLIASCEEFASGPRAYWDVLFVLDRSALFDEDVKEHVSPIALIKKRGLLVYDSSPKLWDVNIGRHITEEHVRLYAPTGTIILSAPMAKMAEDEFGADARDASKLYQTRNLIALGLVAALLDAPKDIAELEIAKAFGNANVRKANLRAFELGYVYAISPDTREAARHLRDFVAVLNPHLQRGHIITGNEAAAHGSFAAGCLFYAGYPITPASEVLEEFAKEVEKLGGIVVQAPDEGEAAQNVLGASFGGARAMTATSGPGFSRMQEACSSFDAMEQPGVIMLSQRGGPGTGLPTRIGQTELLYSIFGGHGDKFRIVLAPGDAQECYYLIQELFNLTEKYQCLGIFLSDQVIAQSAESLPALDPHRVEVARHKLLGAKDIESLRQNNPDWEYKRYDLSALDGISPRAIPGTKGAVIYANSNEHDERGYSSEEQFWRSLMLDKRTRNRYELAKRDFAFPAPVLEGDLGSGIGFISYGAPSIAVRKVVEDLAKRGVATKSLRLRTLWPLERDRAVIAGFINSAKKILVVEHSTLGQLLRLLQMEIVGRKTRKLVSISRDDGWLITPEFIVEKTERWL